jgi:integrase/recombinase XerD
MAKKGSRPATIARYVASTRGFFRFLGEKGSIPDTTIGTLVWQSADHTHRHLPLLTKQELEAILDAPDPLTAIGARNRLILKFFARVDIGATQLAKLTLSQIDLFPDLAAETRDYVNTFRSLITLTRGDQTNILFPAVHGGRLSRHMIWRVLKNAAAMAWVNKELTAHVLRESWTKHMG